MEEDDPKVAANYGVVSYAKSPYVLNMLRYVMGDQAFFKAFQTYIDEYKFRGASIDDFVRVFTKAADSDISWFFDEWIYGICLPDYAFENVEVREGGELFMINGKVKNLGTGKMPVIIQAESEDKQTRKTIWIGSEESVDFKLQTNFPPELLEIDPDKEILQWSTKNDVWEVAQSARLE
jgi:aminopeptidase N